MDIPSGLALSGRLFPCGAIARVQIGDGLIRQIEPTDTPAGADEAGGDQHWIVPGFFDLQVNGFAGRSFADPGLRFEDAEHICLALLRTGVTRLLPTVVTADLDVMCGQLRKIARATREVPLVGAMCPGIHVEGPFLNPEDGPRGAHRREFIRPPNIGDFERLWEASEGLLAMLTLAPDQPGALELIQHVSSHSGSIVVALGHHRATGGLLDRAIAAGAQISTHLGNGADALMPRLFENYIWEQLGDDRLWASFIADGHHIPPATLRCMLRAKPLEQCVLVTDATELAGLAPGRYRRPHGYEVELTSEGKVIIPGTPYLAGSAAGMPQLIAHAMKDGGLTLIDAVRLATVQPHRLMGARVPPWSCAPGDIANLVELVWRPASASVEVRHVVLGRWQMSPAG